MSESNLPPYFSSGGTLAPDAPSYIRRQADEELYMALRRGEYCYILSSRQIGKSSLIVQVGKRLSQANIGVAFLDLNSIGHEGLNQEQWYFSLLMQLGESLEREEELTAFWLQSRFPTPLQKWLDALRCLLHHDPVPCVIFVDEIDQARALPFDAADFFAGIRSCYNRRAKDSEFNRLTFCLIGSALPSELIEDPHLTPFNVGRRIHLRDFTWEEVVSLKAGLECEDRVGTRLLERVCYWTSGHPYLTQRICRAMTETPGIDAPEQVDQLCYDLFFTHDARTGEDNLSLVRDRLLQSGEEVADLLTLYYQIYQRGHLPDTKSRQMDILRLCGIVRSNEGRVQVRNRIYAQVFDPAWVAANMPEQEIERQRQALWRGVRRASILVALSLLAIASSLAAIIFSRAARTENNLRKKAEKAIQLADTANKQFEDTNKQLQLSVYAGDMLRVNRYCDTNNLQRAEMLLAEQREKLGTGKLPFEWRYFWRQCHRDQRTIRAHEKIILTFALTPDGKTLITGSHDKTVKFWEVATGKLLRTLSKDFGPVFRLALSPNGRTLAVSCEEGTIHLLDLMTGTRRTIIVPKETLNFLAFAPDSRTLYTCGVQGTIKRWNIETRQEVSPAFTAFQSEVQSIALSPDGKTLAVTGKILALYDTASGHIRLSAPSAALFPLSRLVYAVAFSPDGHTLAIGGFNGEVRMLEARTMRVVRELPGHADSIHAMTFSRDGRMLATAGWDFSAHLYDVASGKMSEVNGHQDRVNCTAFTPDGKLLVTAGNDTTVKFWEADRLRPSPVLAAHKGSITSLAFSADSQTLFSCGNQSADRFDILKRWDIDTGRQRDALPPKQSVNRIACSPDGKWLATLDQTGSTLILRDTVHYQEISRFHIRPGNSCIVFSPDSRLLAVDESDSNSGLVRLWSLSSRKWERSLPIGNGHVTFLAFSPNSSLLVSAASKASTHSLVVCDLVNGRQMALPTEHHNDILTGAFSPDGKTFTSGSWDSRLIFWDAKTWQPKETIVAHKGVLSALSFSKDSKTLASGGVDGIVKLWNVETRKEVAMLAGHSHGISCLLFSPDSNTLASGDAGGQIILWRAAIHNVIETAND